MTRSKHGHAISPLCLGTVQLGLPYGAANRHGMPDDAQAAALLRAAADGGVTLLDTARAYGLAEARIGAARLREVIVVTKCDPLDGYSEETPARDIAAATRASVHKSCEALRQDVLPYVLLHRAAHMTLAGGIVWRTLMDMPQVQRIGVSVSTPQEALAALAMPEMSAVQLPLHLLDDRWGDVARAAGQRPDVLVLARSSLLQGMLTLPPEAWPVLPPLQSHALCGLLDGWVREFGRKSRADLCVAYVRAQGWVDSVVLGMETLAQLGDNLALFALPPLTQAQCAAIEKIRPSLGEAFLNPALWPKGKETA